MSSIGRGRFESVTNPTDNNSAKSAATVLATATKGLSSSNILFSKHLGVYGGVSCSEAGGGVGSGYINDNTALFLTGIRLKF